MKIGLLGTGRMGAAIGRSLLRVGHEVCAWNRTRSKAEELQRDGATVSPTPAEAARGADLLVSMLADDAAVLDAVLDGPDAAVNGLEPGRVHVSMSTISPLLSERLCHMHSERNQLYVAAPVLGRPEAAERRELVVLVSGSKDAIARSSPIFAAFSKEQHVVGEQVAQANAVKLAVNFALAAVIEVLGESYAFVDRYGVPESRFLDIVNGSLFRSPVIAAYGEKIAQQAFDPAGFRLQLGLKDIRLALDAGEAKAVAMPIASVLRDRFVQAMDDGLKDVDWSAVARAARRKAA